MRAQTSRLADRIMMARRSEARTPRRKARVLVRVLAAHFRPVIPLWAERAAERAPARKPPASPLHRRAACYRAVARKE